MTFIEICGRKIGKEFPPFVIVEIGINHEGDINKAKKMIKDAHKAGAECIKFQCHIIDDEMIKNNVIPQNSKDSIWEIMDRCSFNESQEFELKCIVEELGMIYLNTPFSRKAVDRLEKMNVCAYKIGSGECNNYPLIEYIVNCKKPIILSTGMNNLQSISKSVQIIENAKIPYAILHTTSMYPTPYEKVRLGALTELELKFPNTVIGLSDHSIGNYTSFASVALGASILEKHFTSDQTWDGPDIPISINPDELKNLIFGSDAIHKALGGKKEILPEEKPTINFAYASVVSIKNIMKGEVFSRDNIWVKRPGTGEIRAESYKKILKKTAKENILKNTFLEWSLIEE